MEKRHIVLYTYSEICLEILYTAFQDYTLTWQKRSPKQTLRVKLTFSHILRTLTRNPFQVVSNLHELVPLIQAVEPLKVMDHSTRYGSTALCLFSIK